MKPKYQSEDGVIWDSPAEALWRDSHCAEVKKICDAILPPHYVTSEFWNGSGYVQVSADGWANFVGSAADVILKVDGQECVDNFLRNPRGIIQRELGDRHSPCMKFVTMILNMDNLLRIWGQQYIVAHPEDRKNICLNPDGK